ncbi:beta-N-acetylhexosaminidase [Marinagarivorans algicola]|uniref:beta-N-acetylhexosaminidase n=1 Tax=Marinagarivorans algicola TaxID=1513270 RepID=UPI00192E3AB1|nr:beta-N-acetylhexosaminidase [Marinagarivorans algicola]
MKYSQLGHVMLDVQGTSLSAQEREVIAHPQVGGVILFARNYESVQQLIDLNRQIRACKPNILIAVDHEGGRVQRFKEGFTRIPSMYKLAQAAPTLLGPTAQLMALELMAVGIDFTFAPVLDRFNPESGVIGDRAFSESPANIIEYAGQFIEGLNAEGMAAVGKHFPGHGGVDGDTHLEGAVDSRDFQDIERTDLQPFKQLAAKLQGIMPAHVIFPCVSENPVGFSRQWLEGILRQQLHFTGAILSDDLSMVAAHIAGDPLERGLAAINAGCSMALMCNNPDGAIALIEGLEKQGLVANETRLHPLSAHKRRAQHGFNWHALHKTATWLQTHRAINNVNDM